MSTPLPKVEFGGVKETLQMTFHDSECHLDPRRASLA